MTPEPNTSTATFGRRTGIVTWHPPLDTEFPTDGERQEIVTLIDDEMRTRDAVVFYLNHTTYKGKQIEWSSTLDDDTDVIHIEATLAKRSRMTAAEESDWFAAIAKQIEWYDETFTRTGRLMPDDFEAYQEEFRQWKARKEEGK
ncbi:MAG: hypothetical protein O9247_01235 [Rhodobacteraceae bacterium]|nr:hypothetical protein [Paracoccaceae bacterium]